MAHHHYRRIVMPAPAPDSSSDVPASNSGALARAFIWLQGSRGTLANRIRQSPVSAVAVASGVGLVAGLLVFPAALASHRRLSASC